MISKTLNKTEVKEILSSIRREAEKKWDRTPSGRRMKSIHRAIQKRIDRAMLKVCPLEDRAVLEKYGMIVIRNRLVSLNVDAITGKVVMPYGLRNYLFKVSVLEPTSYNSLSKGEGPDYNVNKWLKKNAPELIKEYIEIKNVRDCEVDSVEAAWLTIIQNCRTSKKLLEEFPEIKKHIPKSVLNYKRKVAPAVKDRASVKEAVDKIRSF